MSDWIATESLHDPLTFVVVNVVAAMAPVPGLSSWANVTGGVIHGTTKAALLVCVGCVLATALSVLVSRILLRDLLLRKLPKSARFAVFNIDRAMRTQTPLSLVALLRLSPAMSFPIVSLLLGLTSLGLGQVLIGTFAGVFIPCFAYAFMGAAGAAAAGADDGVLAYLASPEGATMLLGLITTFFVTKKVGKVAGDAMKPSDEAAAEFEALEKASGNKDK